MDQITVTFRFYNILSKYAGKQQIQINVPLGTTLRQALENLDKNYAPGLHTVLYQEDTISKYIKIFRNKNLMPEEMYNLNLENGDEIMLLPSIAGG